MTGSTKKGQPSKKSTGNGHHANGEDPLSASTYKIIVVGGGGVGWFLRSLLLMPLYKCLTICVFIVVKR